MGFYLITYLLKPSLGILNNSINKAIMASSINNKNEFINELTLPTFHFKTKHFLKFYLKSENGFFAHRNYSTNKEWLDIIDNNDDIETYYDVCEDMHEKMFNSSEYHALFEKLFNTDMRKLFGGMFCMERDYWFELGVDSNEAYYLYHFGNVPAFQKMQVLMCWYLLWGDYGNIIVSRMANYANMAHDLYTTISMSEFTPFYLGAIDKCINDTPQWFVYTIVNIFMHAFNHIKKSRKAKILNQDTTLNVPLWQSYYCSLYEEDPKHFSKPAQDIMTYHYDEEHMETLVPECVLNQL